MFSNALINVAFTIGNFFLLKESSCKCAYVNDLLAQSFKAITGEKVNIIGQCLSKCLEILTFLFLIGFS